MIHSATATEVPDSPHAPHSRSFHARGAVCALIFFPALTVVSLSSGIAPEGSLLDWFFDTAGWIFLVLYATCRIWATLYVGGRKDREMATDGIYSLTRNPLYLGSTCLALAASMFFQSPLLLILTVLVLAFYLQKVIRSEEAFLRQRFGPAFEAYAARTPRFLPRFSAYRTP